MALSRSLLIALLLSLASCQSFFADRAPSRVATERLQGELRQVLDSAIAELPPDYRTVVVLHDIEGLSNPDIAEALGISLPAVKSRIHRSRLFLRQRLSNYLGTA